MSASKYLERKLNDLNCMNTNRQMYGSVDSMYSIEVQNNPKKKSNIFKKIRRLSKKTKSNLSADYACTYETISENESCDNNEKTSLLKAPFQSSKGNKKKYSSLINDNSVGELGNKKTTAKKNVQFATFDSIYCDDKKNKERTKGKKKKSGLLKRTGSLIVRTCRLMTYSSPYMSPDVLYNSQYPPDYRYYNFETGQYEYGYSNIYMGNASGSPSMFF